MIAIVFQFLILDAAADELFADQFASTGRTAFAIQVAAEQSRRTAVSPIGRLLRQDGTFPADAVQTIVAAEPFDQRRLNNDIGSPPDSCNTAGAHLLYFV